MKKKLTIFLDFDGVVNTTQRDGSGMDMVLPIDEHDFELALMDSYFSSKLLPTFSNFLVYCYEKDIDIVVCSSWRYYIDYPMFNKAFNKYFQICKRAKNKKIEPINIFVGQTEKEGKDRGLEILDYVNTHKIENYIVIDDDWKFDILPHISKEHILEIDGNMGFNENKYKEFRKYYERIK